jgi:RNA polymerase sigma-70 factor, ECF subfamily
VSSSFVSDAGLGQVALVRAAQAGDRGAFGDLYVRYVGTVHSIALAHVTVDNVNDIVQEVFLRALQKIRDLRDPEAFGGWLASITRNVARSAMRASSRLVQSEDEVATAETQRHSEDARRALAVIRSLPKAYRETLLMRFVQGMTGPEIADRTGLTPASVRVNLHRGMKLVKQQLDARSQGGRRERQDEGRLSVGSLGRARRDRRAPGDGTRRISPSRHAKARQRR